MFRIAYSSTGGSGTPDAFTFPIAKFSAATISSLVATHSKGLMCNPASSRRIGIVSWRLKRSSPKIRASAEDGVNGYIVTKTETHFGHCPHHESERFLLQLLKRSKN